MTLVNFKLTQYSTGMYSVMATVVRCTLGGKRKSINKLGSYLWHQPKSIGRVFLIEFTIATHSSILVWRAPWTEEPGGLQSMGSQRVGHD